MSKFTSGKWHLDSLTGEIQANGTLIAKVYGATVFNHSRTEIECQANARLIHPNFWVGTPDTSCTNNVRGTPSSY